MANNCSTEYYCVGNKEDIDKLDSVLDIVTSEHRNDLQGIPDVLGYKDYSDWCRGEIQEVYRTDENTLHIVMITAWCEQKLARRAIEECLPSINVYYYDEECGCENFSTNDCDGLFFPWRYHIITDDCEDSFVTLDGAKEFISSFTKKDVSDLDFDGINKYLEEYTKKERENGYSSFNRLYEIEITD